MRAFMLTMPISYISPRKTCFFSSTLTVFQIQNFKIKLKVPLIRSLNKSIQCVSASHQNECRLFRVQFGGDSKEQMLERCCSCVQKLAEYVPVQVTDEQSQQLYHTLHPLGNGENQEQDTEQNASVLLMPDEPLPDSCTSLGERRSVTQLAQFKSERINHP
ncbi:Rec114 [Columba livia]|nr:Rec114 [Columba livia]